MRKDLVDAQLIADAPLLLAEVLRLREDNDLLRSMRKDGIGASYDDHLLAEVKRLREDNKKLHDAINGCAYRGSEGSALDLYCESIIERCPTCYQNIDDMECGCEEE